MNLLKEEHKSNVKDMKAKLDEYETNIQFKTQQLKDAQNQTKIRETDLHRFKEELEKTMKTLKDTTLSFQLGHKTLEEALARKSKEVESLAKSKNCKGCVICLEDLRDKEGNSLIKDLNDKLMDKSRAINSLED